MTVSKKFRVFIAALLPIAAIPNSAALDPARQFYQYEFGYPSEEIFLPTVMNDVAEDENGLLWLATSRGLVAFDGFEAVTYRASQHSGLPSNNITRLFFDSKNRLYVATDDGASVFDGESFMPLTGGDAKVLKAHAFAEGDDGSVWLGTESGLWNLGVDGLTRLDDSDAFGPIRSLLWHNNSLYAGATGTIAVVSDGDLSAIPLTPMFRSSLVFDLEYHQGRLWGASSDGLFRLDGATVTGVATTELDGVSVEMLLSDRDDNLWFAGRRTLGRFFPDGRLELPEVEDNRLGYAPELTSIFEDRLGQHWHTSRFFGLAMVRDTPVQRVSFSEGLLSPNVSAVTVGRDGDIFAATDRGISRVANGATSNILQETFDPHEFVRTMYVDGHGRLYLGSAVSLRVFERENDVWQENVLPPSAQLAVNALTGDSQGNVWVGTGMGLHVLRDGRFERIPASEDHEISSLLVDSNGTLWIGTNGGIATLDDREFEFERIEALPSEASIVAMVELPTGLRAAATADHGLLIGHNGKWRRFGEEHGLPPEQLIDIEARGEDLWLITGAGAFRLTLAETPEDGGEAVEIQSVATTPQYRPNYVAYCCRGYDSGSSALHQDELIMASDDGIVMLNVAASGHGESEPRAYLKSVRYSGQTVAAVGSSPVVLEPNNRDVSIEYSAIHLARGDQVQFRYRLRGLSDSWIAAGRERRANFLSLPPGQFEFELQSTIQTNDWVSEPVSLSIVSTPRAIETAFFRTVLWIAVTGATLAMIGLWLAAARARHRRLEVLIDRRTNELRNLNDRLRETNQELYDSTQKDPLTGLANRRFFDVASANQTLDQRLPASGFVAVLDIDLFKRVNDAYGHAAGDKVLRQFSAMLESTSGADDLIARWGGEEFLVIGEDCSDIPAALDRICACIRESSFRVSYRRDVQLTCSIGCVRYPLTAREPLDDCFATLLEIADVALYAIKTCGRDGWGLIELPDAGNDDGVGMAAFRLGAELHDIVGKKFFRWTTSRPEISLTPKDTVTRLRSISVADE